MVVLDQYITILEQTIAAFSLHYYKNKNIKEAMLAGAEAAAEILQYFGGVGKLY